jgi:UPF0755 protein
LKKKILIGLGILIVLVGLIVGIFYYRLQAFETTKASGDGSPIAVKIPKGAGPLKVAELLAEHKVIDDAKDFYRWIRYYKRAVGQLKAGTLAFRDDMTPLEVLQVLKDGTPVTYKITFPEGLRIDEVAKIFEKHGLAKASEFEKRARSKDFTASLTVPHNSLEGFLYPETYHFRANTPVDEILKTLVEGYRKVFSEKWRKRAQEIGMTELEVLTLAAIVEKETGAAFERPIISGVFHNRLKQNWRMDTDPTVIYAEILATGRFDGNISASDLRRDHPYNTYRVKGLPPGPICSPGKEAIKAALYPKKTDAMFFVSKNDGTHKFCPTLECHNKAVALYQKRGSK